MLEGGIKQAVAFTLHGGYAPFYPVLVSIARGGANAIHLTPPFLTGSPTPTPHCCLPCRPLPDPEQLAGDHSGWHPHRHANGAVCDAGPWGIPAGKAGRYRGSHVSRGRDGR